jgi:hypothetical protein
VPQLSSSWQHNYSIKASQAGWANEQSMYSLMSMALVNGRVHVKKHKQLFEYKHLLLLKDIWWSKF